MEIGSQAFTTPITTDASAVGSATNTLQGIGNQAESLQNGPVGNNIVDLINDLVNQLQGSEGGSLDDLMAGLQQILEQLQAYTGQAESEAEQELASLLTLEIMKMSIRMGIMMQGTLQKEVLDIDVSYS
ncbi:MAG: Unknown protein [uncultured Thiotrichaceae bacterium]|uniref:Uncharacterized protein n=1 Tax=uncultured Thiotrichaceae bacterium TaxID=298394 RepID=A0A6S6TA44_9GAMM|nr:MAG: Unknown protein [uncultured Thiotrichaceae bacterium]